MTEKWETYKEAAANNEYKPPADYKGTITVSADGKSWWANKEDPIGDELWKEMVAETEEQVALAEAKAARFAFDGSASWDDEGRGA